MDGAVGDASEYLKRPEENENLAPPPALPLNLPSTGAALGDGYLKRPVLSAAPYKANLPYITAKPKVRSGDRDSETETETVTKAKAEAK